MKLLEAALAYIARGWLVFPIVPGGKRPVVTNGFKAASRDRAQIETWWLGRRAWTDRNIGITTSRESGIWVLDSDVDKETGEFGEDTVSELQAIHGQLPRGPVQRTPGGGYHRFFAWPTDGEDVPRRIRFAPGLDALGERTEDGESIAGYLIIAPSVRTDGIYEWIVSPDECPLPQAPKWLLDMIRVETTTRPAELPYSNPVFDAGTNAYGRKALQDICSAVSACSPGNQMDTLFRSAVRVGSLAGGGNIEWNEAFQNLVNAGVSMRPGDPKDPWTAKVVEKNVRKGMDLGAKDPTRIESRPARQYERIVNDNPQAPMPDSEPVERPKPQLIVNNPEKPKPKEKPKAAEWRGREWMADHSWIMNKDGDLKPQSLLNIQNFMRHCPALKSLFWYDEFGDQIMIEGPLPKDPPVGAYPRPIQDTDETALASWLNGNAGLSPSISVAAQVLREAAFINSRDPFLEWAKTLKWDGKKRIDTWLTYYGGAEDSDYTRLVGRRFLISAMARGMDPGCKVDTMLILEGPQGLKKSTLVRLLCGGEWYSDQVGEIHNKDASQLVQGIWIMEIPEMDKFSKAESNAVKAFLSRLFDRYRPPYGRNVVKRQRRCVFFGTINPDGVGYLSDTTGARRFLPVMVVAIDIEGIIADRDQIWAEALTAYRAGEKYWFDEDEKYLLAPEQEKRRNDDIWETRIREWLDNPMDWKFDGERKFKTFTITDILWVVLSIDLKSQKQADKNRIAKILKLFGCNDVQHRNGIKGRSWEYEG